MRRLVILAAGVVLVVALAASSRDAPIEPGVEQWPEADALFHQDPRWLGSDGGISVDLGGGRSVWLFPDTFVALGETRFRESSCLIRNTVAVMEGRNPETATMTFHWGTAGDGSPESFFPKGRDICFAEDDAWFWPGDGERLGENGPLVIFLMRQRPSNEGLGFERDGFEVVLVTNPDADPREWQVEPVRTRPNSWGVDLGEPSIFVDGEWLYAFGTSDQFEVRVARWPLDAVVARDLTEPEWWVAEERGFASEAALRAEPAVLFAEALPESLFASGAGYVALQTIGFGASSLGARTALSFTGPWSPLQELWQPPESSRPGIYVYGFKAHPALEAGDAVAITYATNHEEFDDLVADTSIGYPRFARLRLEP